MISVMGFDDIELASYVKPGLSTVRILYFDEGALAAQTLFSLMKRTVQDVMDTHYVPHQVIRRQSTKYLEEVR